MAAWGVRALVGQFSFRHVPSRAHTLGIELVADALDLQSHLIGPQTHNLKREKVRGSKQRGVLTGLRCVAVVGNQN